MHSARVFKKKANGPWPCRRKGHAPIEQRAARPITGRTRRAPRSAPIRTSTPSDRRPPWRKPFRQSLLALRLATFAVEVCNGRSTSTPVVGVPESEYAHWAGSAPCANARLRAHLSCSRPRFATPALRRFATLGRFRCARLLLPQSNRCGAEASLLQKQILA